jgi:hypothetical protein
MTPRLAPRLRVSSTSGDEDAQPRREEIEETRNLGANGGAKRVGKTRNLGASTYRGSS